MKNKTKRECIEEEVKDGLTPKKKKQSKKNESFDTFS